MSNEVKMNIEKAAEMLRKSALAYVGLNVVAFETARERFEEARKSTDGLFERFVAKGEEIEAQAGETLQDVRTRTGETMEDIRTRIQGFAANDRAVEIKVQTKKTKPAAKKTTVKKTTVKKAAGKKPVKKTTTKKTTAKKATKKAA